MIHFIRSKVSGIAVVMSSAVLVSGCGTVFGKPTVCSTGSKDYRCAVARKSPKQAEPSKTPVRQFEAGSRNY